MFSAESKHEMIVATLLLTCLTITLASMWPALSGPFLFDDKHNLEPLAAEGGITDWVAWRNFVFSGGAGRLGRPVSLMSFTLNDMAWPSDPWPFKYTNLLIHLLNGLLIFVFATQLSRLAGAIKGNEHYIGVAVMALWLLHPMQLSTVMLVVQRMTELAALFVLCGAVCYLHGRRIAAHNSRRGYLWMSAGIGIGGVLAALSKENGILLVLYVLAVEFTLLNKGKKLPRPAGWHAWSAVFLWAPLALLATYLALNWQGNINAYNWREFTLMERLLTQPRILFEYLQQIFIPQLGGSGLFHDDYAWSTGLLDPPSTLLSILGLLGLFLLAVWQRARQPVLALAILWFLAGHVLESSFISLELYFEHRNYLPMFGPLFALGFYAFQTTPKLKRVLPGLLALFITIATLMTWQSSQVWGDHARLANVWAAESPTSVRAQQTAADYWFRQGDLQKTRHCLETGLAHHPERLLIHLQLLMLDCLQGKTINQRMAMSLAAAEKTAYDAANFKTLQILQRYVRERRCPELTYEQLIAVNKALLINPTYTEHGDGLSQIHFELARLHAARRNLNLAIKHMDNAYAAAPSPDIALNQAALLLSAGLPDAAMEYIEKARRADAGTKLKLHDKKRFIDAMEQAAREMQAKKANQSAAKE